MDKKNRRIVKNELKAIAISKVKLDKQVYDYFMDNINIGLTDKEIVNLIYNILYRYEFDNEDYEIIIADFLFTQISIRNHPKFNELYANSYVFNKKNNFELLLKHNVAIVQEVVKFMEGYLESIEIDIYYHLGYQMDDYRSMLNTIKLYTRKQKIENIRNKKRIKIKMINDLIISPLLISKTS